MKLTTLNNEHFVFSKYAANSRLDIGLTTSIRILVADGGKSEDGLHMPCDENSLKCKDGNCY